MSAKPPASPAGKAPRSRSVGKDSGVVRKKLLDETAPVAAKPPSTPTRRLPAAEGAADAETPAKVLSSEKSVGYLSAKALFGNERTLLSKECEAMYKVVNKCTGSLGGNGAGGAIYGGKRHGGGV